MGFPRFVVPKLSHSLRNWFISKTLITPYFDNDFSIKDFSSGAKHAATTVANSLAEGELDPLNSCLSPECLDLVSKNISLFKPTERAALGIEIEDIYFSFVYQIGILMEDHPTEENKSIRHVEITWVGQHFPNYLETVEQCGSLTTSPAVKRVFANKPSPASSWSDFF